MENFYLFIVLIIKNILKYHIQNDVNCSVIYFQIYIIFTNNKNINKLKRYYFKDFSRTLDIFMNIYCKTIKIHIDDEII